MTTNLLAPAPHSGDTRAARRAARPAALRRVIACALFFFAVLVSTALAQNPVPLPDGTVGQYYSMQLTTQEALPNLNWTQTGGTLPDGINLNNATGALTGVPTKAGTFNFQLTVADSAHAAVTGAQLFRVTMKPALHIVAPTLPPTPEPVRAVPDQSARRNQKPPDEGGSNSDELSIGVANALRAADLAHIDPNKLTIKKGEEADVIDALLADQKLGDGDYCIVQIVKWKQSEGNEKEAANKYEAQDHWSLYQRGRDPKDSNKVLWTLQEKQAGERIFGSKRVAALLIHLGALPTWDIKYTVKVTERIPANVQNVLDLAGVIFNKSTTDRLLAVSPVNLWGGQLLTNINDIPSNVAFSGSIQFLNDSGSPAQQPKEYAKSYINEGRYHWDVSAGLPVKSFSEVQYDASNGLVTAKKVERQNAYGFLNLFLNPKGVDLSDDSYLKTLHLVMGVPISGKPLDRPMVGLGMGIYKTPLKFNIFAGAVFNRVRELSKLQAGQPATQAALESDLRTRRVTKFIFGINLPIKQFTKALGAKKE